MFIIIVVVNSYLFEFIVFFRISRFLVVTVVLWFKISVREVRDVLISYNCKK